MRTMKKTMKKTFELSYLVPDKSKDILKKYELLWTKMRNVIKSKINNLHNYNEKYMKMKFNSHGDVSLMKTIELRNMIVFVRSLWGQQTLSSSESIMRMYYLSLLVLFRERVWLSATSALGVCIICHYWYFLD